MTLNRTITAILLLLSVAGMSSSAQARKLRQLPRYSRYRSANANSSIAPHLRIPCADADQESEEERWQDFLRVREPAEIISSLDTLVYAAAVPNPLLGPVLFTGYEGDFDRWTPCVPSFRYQAPDSAGMPGSIPARQPEGTYTVGREQADRISRSLARMRYEYMVLHPEAIDFASWMLPDPPSLPPEDYSFTSYIRRLRLPSLDGHGKGLTKRKIERINWLHVFNGGIQFSQAYLSRNWYQGGNNHLSLLINFYWNVALNQAYHPNLMFQNTVSYKLGLNSASQDEYHKYSISEDLLQWNMNFGLKARANWYYSLTAQFKTQLLNSYAENSMTRTAAFLSPGELNVGLGMTYSRNNKYKTFQLKVAISPLSYNLKTCLDRQVDPTQFGISAGREWLNEIGSSAETTLQWDITGNISYRSRLFIFTDYRNYSQDWENTLSFNINRFLSTQVYAHLRYDTSGTRLPGWGHWMLKEILSFGFSYAFSTK